MKYMGYHAFHKVSLMDCAEFPFSCPLKKEKKSWSNYIISYILYKKLNS